ncbi:MAG TPA: hypothetical protein VFT74_09335 [Isosphaeraceae bacterium]|nr:hypothetical protein [Isosphaeraceae bacterium]
MTSDNKIDWKAEQDRFTELAYDRAERAARRAFKRWHERKRADAIAEMVGKVWATWAYNLMKGKDPLALLGPNIRWAILWVRYDRKIAGRGRCPDVFDYRSGMRGQQLSEQGQASPTDRSHPGNAWINWSVDAGADDPSELVAALDGAGMAVAEYL